MNVPFIWPSVGDELYYSAPLKVLRECASEHVCRADDVLTLDRETARGDLRNLVLVLEAARGIPNSTASPRVMPATEQRGPIPSRP